MILYFGAPNLYSELKSAEQVGSGRKGEEDRPDFRDKVFLTTCRKTARYYGKFVYTVKADADLYWKVWAERARSNSMSRKRTQKNIEKKIKTLKRNETIYVADPNETKILSVEECNSRNKG